MGLCERESKDLDTTDAIAEKVLEELKNAPEEIQQQMDDNIVGSKELRKMNCGVSSTHMQIVRVA